MKSIGPYVVSAIPAPAVLHGSSGGHVAGGNGAGPEVRAVQPEPSGTRRQSTPPSRVAPSAAGIPSESALPLHGIDRLTGMPVLLHRLGEFVVPASMPESPYLLPVYEVDVWDGQPYAITELPLSATPATHPGTAALGALRALSVLHAAGQVHGNVNAAQLWQVGREVRLAGAGLPRPQGTTPATDLAALGQALDSLGARPAALDHLETLNTQQALEALENALHGQRAPERSPEPAAPAQPPQIDLQSSVSSMPEPRATEPPTAPAQRAAPPEEPPRKPNFLASIRRRGKGKASAPAVQSKADATPEASPEVEAGPVPAASPALTPDPVSVPIAQSPDVQEANDQQIAARTPTPEAARAAASALSEPKPVSMKPVQVAPPASEAPRSKARTETRPAAPEVTTPLLPAEASSPPQLPLPAQAIPETDEVPAPTPAEPVSYRSAADIIVIGEAASPEGAASEVRATPAAAEAVPVRLIPAPIRIGFDETLPLLSDWTLPEAQQERAAEAPTSGNEQDVSPGRSTRFIPASSAPASAPPAVSPPPDDGQTGSRPPGRESSVRNQPLRIGWEEDHSWRVVKPGPERHRVQVPVRRGPLPRPLLMALAALLVLGGLAYWWRGQGATPTAGCCTQRFTVSGSTGSVERVQVTLEQAPPGSPLAAGAVIGTVPGTLKFPDVPGSYTLKFTAAGHGSLDGVVTVPSDQPFDIVLK